MASHNLSKIKFDDLEILGYSVAGEESVVAIPQLDVCFDIGKSPDQLISINNLLLSHGHIDHSAGIAYYLSHRKFSGQKAGTILAPVNTIEPIKQIIQGFSKLDGSWIEADFVPIRPGDEYQIKPNLWVRAFAAKHNQGALGFTVIEKRMKLKPEYLELSGNKIAGLKKSGIEIDYEIEIPLVSYTGDTSYQNFSGLDFVANSKILITECTFVVDEHADKAEAGKHLHIDGLVKMLGELNNEYVLITHLSQRTHIGEAKRVLEQKLSKERLAKTVLLMDKYSKFRVQ